MERNRTRSQARRRAWRAAGVWLLFAAQLQLIFVAELHRHGYPLVATRRHAAVSPSRKNSGPPPLSDTVCVVCQIVRQSAARAAVMGRAVRPSNRVIFQLSPTHSFLSARAIATLPARAPPSPLAI